MTDTQFGPDGWTPDMIGSLTGKTYLITGANSGAGFEASRTLLSKGAKVVMLNRSAEKSAAAIAELKGEFGGAADVTFMPLDLASLTSVREAAGQVLDSVPQIDALICNAAIAQVPEQQTTMDGFESQLGVNHLGHFLLCGLLFDRVDASHGRIVVVGSNAYRMGLKRIKFEDLNFDENYTAWNSYAQSKLAQMMFGFELQRRIESAGRNVEVYVCHPGASRTSLIDTSGGWLNKLIWRLVSPIIAQSAEKGSRPEVMCAAQEELKPATLYGPTRRGETVGPVGKCKLHPVALDHEMADRLWKISEDKVGLDWTP